MSRKPGLLRQDVILQDKARRTCDLLRHCGWEVTDHPPYGPDLAPSNFHLSRSNWLASDLQQSSLPRRRSPLPSDYEDGWLLQSFERAGDDRNSQPHRWETLPTFQCRGSCFNYQSLSVHCGSRWFITIYQGDKLRQIFLPRNANNAVATRTLQGLSQKHKPLKQGYWLSLLWNQILPRAWIFLYLFYCTRARARMHTHTHIYDMFILLY